MCAMRERARRLRAPHDEALVVSTVLAVQTVRAALYGFGAVLLGTVLAQEGVSDLLAGAIFTVMLVGMALASLAVGRWSDAAGVRATYITLFAVLGVSGTVFALTSWLPVLFLAALTGTLSTDPNESGPITSLEQAMLSGVAADRRPVVFGRYNALAYLGGSAGALAAGAPGALRHLLPALPAEQRWLLAFPAVAVVCALLAFRLPPSTERSAPATVRRGLGRSRGSVRRLAALFSVDAFGGGLVVTSFVVFWFERHLGAPVGLMALVFFGVGVLQGASSLAAAPLAHRIGLLNTMVFTHLPSNVLLAAIPLMPTLPLAIAALLARSALSQMDVPARQAYIAALVEPEERLAAAAQTNAARYAARPLGPVAAGSLMQRAAPAAPFIAAGVIKCAYDLVLFARFRRVAIPEAKQRAAVDRVSAAP